MNDIYEEMIVEMLNLLKGSEEELSEAHTASTMTPLFCITNQKFNLLKHISSSSNYQVLNFSRNLCIKLCQQQGMNVIDTTEVKNLDFAVNANGILRGFYLSVTCEYFLDIGEALSFGIDEMFNIVLQESEDNEPIFYKPNSRKYKGFQYKDKINHVTIKQFFELIGVKDYDDFRECVGRYNYEAEQILGLTISPIPTCKALAHHKSKVREKLLSFFYENELKQHFTNVEILNMKKWFSKNVDVLLSDTSFSKSFISSEWYYELQVKTDVGLEQTAIVAGYLKSIEQLLCAILLTLNSNYDFYFLTNSSGKKQYGKKKLPLTKNNLKLLLTMGRNLIKTIRVSKHVVLYKTAMTDRVLDYLDIYFEKTRNGYLHKDNLYEWPEIESIREKTYCTYFLILSTFKINVEELSHIDD